MADATAAIHEERHGTGSTGHADLVIGLVSPPKDQQAISRVAASTAAALASLPQPVRAVLAHAGYQDSGTIAPDENLRMMPMPAPSVETLGPVQAMAEGFRAVADIAKNVNARACAVITSDPSIVDQHWITRLAAPVLENGFDLVTPCYARQRFEGLINRGIMYPLTRALYGKRVRNPFGPDFCLSARLVSRLPTGSGAAMRTHPAAWITPEAIVAGFRICQSHLGMRSFPAPEEAGLSALLVQVLGPVFTEIERRAAFLQRVRGTQPVEEFGSPVYLPESDAGANIGRLVESFQIGARNLQEIWSMVLPPSTLVELKRLSRAAAASFRLDDELWARIVYDFALAYRLRTINRDHLLRAITPLYLGWVASYATDPENTSAEAAEHILERLCLAYENARPYFVARWRWPDRFNP